MRAQSAGNSDLVVCLDGGKGDSAEERVDAVLSACAASPTAVVAECGGGTDSEQQAMVAAISAAVAAGRPVPCGLAFHSYLLAGAAPTGGAAPPVRGLSVAEPCVDWTATQTLVRSLAAAVRERRERRGPPATHEGGEKRHRGK